MDVWSLRGLRMDVRKILFGFAFWTVVSLAFVLPLLGRTADIKRTVLAALVQWWLWGLMAPGILAINRMLPFSSGQVGRRIAAHLAIGPFITAVYALLLATARAILQLGDWSQTQWRAVRTEAVRELFWSLLVYFMIVAASEAYLYQKRYAHATIRAERFERTATEARLSALRSQLDPHFLFNTLNAISAYTERDPKLARGMIEHLGDLLRLSLKTQGREFVPLREELTFVEHYLALQKMRFRNRLHIDMDIAAEAVDALIPGMLLQPLVENAIRHGIAPQTEGGRLRISARIVSGQLAVRVHDNGAGLRPAWSLDEQEGLGLRLTRERLAVRYPESTSRFSVSPADGGGTEVDIAIPFHTEEEGLDEAIA